MVLSNAVVPGNDIASNAATITAAKYIKFSSVRVLLAASLYSSLQPKLNNGQFSTVCDFNAMSAFGR